MSEDQKFVCTVADHPTVQKALDELTAYQAESKERKKFIEKQLKALDDDRKRHWQALWDAAQSAGCIDPSLKYKDWGISLGDNRKQLFIEPSCGHEDCDHGMIGDVRIIPIGGGIGGLLSSLLGKDPKSP